jgi:hypothetical protein
MSTACPDKGTMALRFDGEHAGRPSWIMDGGCGDESGGVHESWGADGKSDQPVSKTGSSIFKAQQAKFAAERARFSYRSGRPRSNAFVPTAPESRQPSPTALSCFVGRQQNLLLQRLQLPRSPHLFRSRTTRPSRPRSTRTPAPSLPPAVAALHRLSPPATAKRAPLRSPAASLARRWASPPAATRKASPSSPETCQVGRRASPRQHGRRPTTTILPLLCVLVRRRRRKGARREAARLTQFAPLAMSFIKTPSPKTTPLALLPRFCGVRAG